MIVKLKGESPKKFNISDADFGEHLSELESKEEYERVSVKVKIIATTDPVTLPNGKRIQEVLVADAAKCTLCLLPSNVRKFGCC